MAATTNKRKPAAKSLPRRTPDFVRPYLTRAEVAAVATAIRAASLDTSSDIVSALAELDRWTA